jgi:hypothetical protein
MRLSQIPLPVPSSLFAWFAPLAGLALSTMPAVAQCALASSFAPSVALASTPSSSSFVLYQRVADFDGDGLVDLAVVRSGVPLSILRNLGGGSFANVPLPALGLSPRVEIADFDQDGRPDLLMPRGVPLPGGPPNQNDLAVEFWRNTTTVPGNPTFVLADSRVLGQPLTQTALPALMVGDVDADGIQDVVVRRTTLTTIRGGGSHGVASGTFGGMTVSPTFTGSHYYCQLFDVDQDGALDVVAGTGYYVFLHPGLVDASGRPNGSYATPVSRNFGGFSWTGVAGDLDGDGLLDIVSSDQSQLTLHRGLPGFQFAGAIPIAVNLCEEPFFGDFDRDGELEICVPRGTQWWNMNVAFVDDPFGAATVTMMQIDAGYPENGVAADFDGDGRLDFAIGKGTGEVVFGRNTCAVGSAPQVTVVSPNGGEPWTAGSLQTVQWSVAGNYATFDVDLSTDAGATWRPLARAVPGSSCTVWATEPSSNTALVRVQPSSVPTLGDVSNGWFTIGGAGLASANAFGQGCGAPVGLSTFATPPRFGATSTIAVLGAVPGVPVACWLSLPAVVPFPFLPGCALHLEPAFTSLVGAPLGDASGVTLLPLPVPNVPQLAGLELVVQPTAFASSPAAGQIGNPVRLVLGF